MNIRDYFTHYYSYRLFKKILGIVQSIFIIVMIAGVLAAIALVFFTLNARQLMVIQK
jgi:cell division protein FtsL